MNYEKEYKEFSKWWEELTDKNPNWKTLERLAAKDAWMEATKRAEVNGVDTSQDKALHKHFVTNSLPDLTLDEADVLAKETDYACYACEDTEEINWGDASAFFIEGYQYAIKKFRQ